ncbi:hypothetical protein PGPR2_30960 [Pseudomonas aeruginosa PGPR2]|nr:hypothetical protein PGPR2_30960 [Pseudomonas aeruginosa PGPR2]
MEFQSECGQPWRPGVFQYEKVSFAVALVVGRSLITLGFCQESGMDHG